MCNFGFQSEALNTAFMDIFEELLVLDVEKKIIKSSFYQSHVVAFGFAKMILQCRGVILHEKKFCKTEVPQIYPRMPC